ncbi:hypothetical protein EVAR_61744_1 [Eumeta japonica]|uniref:Uncharacterized protein n=1 Tax=Eumeta variegata TaxID=151549 RepID=A0A4C1YNJ6_EUMVA|nr:hypothetical protein EVAR_61744_1 [Eumeta japonica]
MKIGSTPNTRGRFRSKPPRPRSRQSPSSRARRRSCSPAPHVAAIARPAHRATATERAVTPGGACRLRPRGEQCTLVTSAIRAAGRGRSRAAGGGGATRQRRYGRYALRSGRRAAALRNAPPRRRTSHKRIRSDGGVRSWRRGTGRCRVLNSPNAIQYDIIQYKRPRDERQEGVSKCHVASGSLRASARRRAVGYALSHPVFGCLLPGRLRRLRPRKSTQRTSLPFGHLYAAAAGALYNAPSLNGMSDVNTEYIKCDKFGNLKIIRSEDEETSTPAEGACAVRPPAVTTALRRRWRSCRSRRDRRRSPSPVCRQ